MFNPFKTKLSRRLMFSFLGVSLIPLAVGLFAVGKMRGVSGNAQNLSHDYVPEVVAATEIERQSYNVMYGMRGYRFSGRQDFLADAEDSLGKLDLAIAEADKLKNVEVLVRLRSDLPLLKEKVAEYKAMKQKTIDLTNQVKGLRETLAKEGDELDQEVEQYLQSQLKLQAEEFATPGTAPEAMQERAGKIATMGEVSRDIAKLRLKNWKSQESEDLKALEELVRNDFAPLEPRLIELRGKSKREENRIQVDQILAAYKSYNEGTAKMLGIWQERGVLDEARNAKAHEVLSLCSDIAKTGAEHTQKIADTASQSLSSASAAIVVGLACALALGALIAIGITRALATPLEYLVEGTNKLGSSVSEISATASELAASSLETSASVSEISTTVEEVRQTTQVSNEKARRVSDQAERLAETAEAGQAASKEAIDGMARIKQEMEYIAESILKLSEQTQNISEITGAVNDLADQSNLLSVNAAIEAAKAGEYGKGFAVVAQEVKNLAEQSKEATNQIKTILNDIQKATSTAVMATERGTKAVDSGVMLSIQSRDTIAMLLENVRQSAAATLQISASSQQQLTGMDQLVTAMRSIKEASSQNVSGTKQLEVSTQILNEMGGKLREISQKYSS